MFVERSPICRVDRAGGSFRGFKEDKMEIWELPHPFQQVHPGPA
jgi:hypothetical protein